MELIFDVMESFVNLVSVSFASIMVEGVLYKAVRTDRSIALEADARHLLACVSTTS